MFYENYLGKLDATFTLNFSTGASMVLAQYYNFVRLGREGYTYVMKQMQQNAQALADGLRRSGRFEVIGGGRGAAAARGLPALRRRRATTSPTSPGSCSAERGWMVPAYTLPPDAQDVKIMRALVKETHEPRAGRPAAPATSRTPARPWTARAAPTRSSARSVKQGSGY